MGELQRRHTQIPARRPTSTTSRIAVAATRTLAGVEQRATEIGHTVTTNMKITELIAEAEIAQDKLDRQGQI